MAAINSFLKKQEAGFLTLSTNKIKMLIKKRNFFFCLEKNIFNIV